MKFRLEFDVDNSAFWDDDAETEEGQLNRTYLMRLIGQVASGVGDYVDRDEVRDVNGNPVGYWQISE